MLTLYTTPVIYLWFDRLAEGSAQDSLQKLAMRTERGGGRHEFFRNFHKAPCGHDPSDNRDDAGRSGRLLSPAGGPAARDLFSDHIGPGGPSGADPETMATPLPRPWNGNWDTSPGSPR